jgi:hypothetical protein
MYGYRLLLAALFCAMAPASFGLAAETTDVHVAISRFYVSADEPVAVFTVRNTSTEKLRMIVVSCAVSDGENHVAAVHDVPVMNVMPNETAFGKAIFPDAPTSSSDPTCRVAYIRP